MRREDWPERLNDFIDARRDMPFAWGENDCSSFAVGALVAMTGERPPVPTAANERDAARLLLDAPLRVRADELYGPAIMPSLAQRGDLVLMDLFGRPTLGVSLGDGIAAPGADGVIVFPLSAAVAAWRI